MARSTLLIVYDTTDGQTELIARRLASAAESRGLVVRAAHVKNVDVSQLGQYDNFIVAAPIRFDRYSRAIRAFVQNELAGRNRYSAFVSVSGSSAAPEGEEQARKYVTKFLAETKWVPDDVCLIGGAFKFTQYNPLLRFVMKRIAAKKGLPADTKRDYEYTDWNKLEQFETSFLARAGK